MHRLRENGRYDSWMIVEKTKKKALVFYVQGMAAANGKSRFVKLKGLKAQSRYRIDRKRIQRLRVDAGGA